MKFWDKSTRCSANGKIAILASTREVSLLPVLLDIQTGKTCLKVVAIIILIVVDIDFGKVGVT